MTRFERIDLYIKATLAVLFIASAAFYCAVPIFPLWLKTLAGIGYTVLGCVYLVKLVELAIKYAVKAATKMGLNDKN